MSRQRQTRGPVVLCYDASEEARRAIEEAGRLFPAAQAAILHVWRSSATQLPVRPGLAGVPAEVREAMARIDEEAAADAKGIANEGEAHAREVGLRAEGVARRAAAEVWLEIVEFANERNAAVVVLGARGLGRVKSIVLGSVSHAVAQHCSRPTLVVPARAPMIEVERPPAEALVSADDVLLIPFHDLATPGPGGD